MATIDAPRRPAASFAASRALDAEIEASLSGSQTYPDGTVFVPEHLAEQRLLDQYRRAGTPVAVISDTGDVELLRPSVLRPEALIIGLIFAGLLLWAISRSRGAMPSASSAIRGRLTRAA